MTYFFVYILLLSSGAWLHQIMERGTSENAALQFVWIANYAIIILFVAKRMAFWKKMFHQNSYGLIIMLLTMLLSSIWSIDPYTTFRRASALVLSYIAMVGILTSVSEKSLVQSFNSFFSLVIGITFLTYFVSPDSVLTDRIHHTGAWSGPFSHHNTLGRIAAISALFYIIHRHSNRKKIFSNLMIFMSIAALYLSNSEGAWLFFLGALILLGIIYLFRQGKRMLILYLYGTAIIIIVVLFQYEAFLSAFNKSDDLTGRVFLWQKAISDLSHQPILGFGYGVYWDYYTLPLNTLTPEIELLWDAPHSHNGYIEVALASGVVGLVIYLIVIGQSIKDSWLLINSTSLSPQNTFCIILLFFVVLTGLFINTPFVRNDFNFFVFLYGYLTLRAGSLENTAQLRGSQIVPINDIPSA